MKDGAGSVSYEGGVEDVTFSRICLCRFNKSGSKIRSIMMEVADRAALTE